MAALFAKCGLKSAPGAGRTFFKEHGKGFTLETAENFAAFCLRLDLFGKIKQVLNFLRRLIQQCEQGTPQ
jgi:hypothetical protein